MIKTESLTINGRAFIRTYSDEGRYVVRDGVSYEEAVDPADKNRTYTEGEYISSGITQDVIDEDADLTDEQVVSILMGGNL